VSAEAPLSTMAMGILVGLGMVAFGGQTLVAQQQAISTYEPVEATVLSSEVSVHRNAQGTMYSAAITYRYSVDGRTYESSDVRPGPGGWRKGEEWARRVVRTHPEGATATAYYDPDDPGESYLVEDRSLLWPSVIAGVGLLLAAGLSRKLVGTVRAAGG
jgi:hypothetical protein